MPLRDQWGARNIARRARPPGPSSSAIAGAFIALLALLGAGAWLYVKSEQLRVPTDPHTLCPTDRPVTDLTVVLLDVSDHFSDPQLVEVKNDLARIRDGIPRFGLIEIYTLAEGQERLVTPLLRLCQPGTGADLNELYQNPQLARERWEKGFKDALDRELDQLLRQPSASSSPIYEAIQSTALYSFGNPAYDHVPKHLIIFSDLLQYVPGKQSQYRGVPDFNAFRRSAYFAQVRSNLDGVQVDIYYLNRSDIHVQGFDHIHFWDEYFAAQGATVRSVERIYGDR